MERKSEPKGWLIVGKIYKEKLLDDISRTTNSKIKIVLPDSIKSFEKDLMNMKQEFMQAFLLKILITTQLHI